MAEYVGAAVILKLKDEAATQLRGVIADFQISGQETELVLSDVVFLQTGHTLASHRVPGSIIADLDIVKDNIAVQKPPSQPHTQYPAYPQPSINANVPYYSHPQYYQPQTPVPVQPAPQQAQAEFVDPAIISMARKKPDPIAQAAAFTQSPMGLVPPQASYASKSPKPAPYATPTRTPAIPATPTMSRAGSTLSLRQQQQAEREKAPPPAKIGSSLQQAFAEMSVRADNAADSSALDETDDGFSVSVPPRGSYDPKKFSGKRMRRGGKRNSRQEASEQGSSPAAPNTSQVLRPGMFGGAIAQAAVAATHGVHASPAAEPRRRRRRDHRNRPENGHTTNGEEEGWATEDVNDYKETEFDFQGNLDRFDKKTVFSQIKAEDTTAEDTRLVSFNRLPNRSKEPAKKNYRNSENVLGTYANGRSLAERDGWNTPDFIAEESEDSDDDSDMHGYGNGNAADSGRSSRRAMSRQSLSNRRSTRQLSSNNVTSKASVDNLSGGGAAGKSKPCLRLASNRSCPMVNPLQMLEVERIAETELGLTDDMMTENAGRGIAQVAMQAFGKRITSSNHNALPVVIVFAGNNKSGARAIASGRHMQNHHVRVMVCVLGLDREDELLENVRRQLNIFRNADGRVSRWEEMQNSIKSLDSPPELIIDGLLGMHMSFEDLRMEQQATAYEMIQFANKSKGNVLSVDVPSGVDGSTGEVAELEEGSGAFYMRSQIVVALGAPKSGLLHASISGIGSSWKLYVADIGISKSAWRKINTRRRHGVEFGAEWIVALHYHNGA